MILNQQALQLGTTDTSLVVWFVVSAVLITLVTLIYVYVLSKSPPPEKFTQIKLEARQTSVEVPNLLVSSENALRSSDFRSSIDYSIKAVALTLATLLEMTGANLANMNVSDLAYLVQSKFQQLPDITQHIYNLNLLHLKAAQGHLLTAQEAEWALNISNWLVQLAQAGKIKP